MATADVASLHRALTRFARSRLRDLAMADDAVSETFVALLESRIAAAGTAPGRAWAFGVLRHKIVDQLRRHGRELPSGDLDDDAHHANAMWRGDDGALSGPESLLARRQLARQLARSCDRLPPTQRQAFVMRQVWEWDSADVCRHLAVTEGHLGVLVHRARQRLQVLLRREHAALGWHGRPSTAGNARRGAATDLIAVQAMTERPS